MAFGIPNDVAGGTAKQHAQAAPDSVDIDILIAGHNLTGVQSGCAVTAQGSPNMTLAVASGTVGVAGVAATVTSGNVTITTADASRPRFDLVVVNSSGTKSVTAGTPAAAPVFPAMPASSVVLAAVYVGAGVSSIATADIVDKRVILNSTTYAPAGTPRVPHMPVATVSVEDPYTLSSSFTHPDVLYFPAGWGADSNAKAWKYWMVATPYWRAITRFENPSVFVSDDGINWVAPAGLTNPVDASPQVSVATQTNSDPDLCYVTGTNTLHMYYRQYDSATNEEWVMHRSSTNGITWSAETTCFTTFGTSPANAFNMLSPTVVHDGTKYIMFVVAQGTHGVDRRTSTDGVTWSAATAVVNTNWQGTNYWHMDAVLDSGTIYTMIVDEATASTDQSTNSARAIYLGKSTDGGLTFSFGTLPIIHSEFWGQRVIYRCGFLHSTKHGKDYYRIWVGGVSYTLDDTAAAVAREASNLGVESWLIGYTEGYDPNDPPASDPDTPSQYLTGDILTTGVVRGDEVGGNRLFARVLTAIKGRFDRLRAVELHAQAAYFEGPLPELDTNGTYISDWATALGYDQSHVLPAVVIASDPTQTGGVAGLDIHTRSPDNSAGIDAKDYWRIKHNQDGSWYLRRWDNTAGTLITPIIVTKTGTITALGALIAGGQLTATGLLVANNDAVSVAIKDSGGTARRVALIDGSNNVLIGDVDGSAAGGMQLRGHNGITTRHHLVANDGAPAIAVGAAAGTGPSVSIAGKDTAGAVTVTVGTSPATGVMATITFGGTSQGTTPRVILTPASAAAATNVPQVYVTQTSTTFVINAVVAPTASVAYIWNFQVIWN